MGGQRIIDVAGKEWFEPLHPANVQLTGSNVTDAQTLWTPGMLYNETTSDKPRANTQGTLLASAARTATTISANITNYNAKGIMVWLDVTGAPVTPGAGGLYVAIKNIDNVLAKGYVLNTSHALVTTAIRIGIELYPGATSAGIAGDGNLIQRTAGSLSRIFQVAVVHGDAQAYTYSLSYGLII